MTKAADGNSSSAGGETTTGEAEETEVAEETEEAEATEEIKEAVTIKVKISKHHRRTSSFTSLHLLECHRCLLGLQYSSCLRPLQRRAQPQLKAHPLHSDANSSQRQLPHSKLLEVADGWSILKGSTSLYEPPSREAPIPLLLSIHVTQICKTRSAPHKGTSRTGHASKS